MVSAVYFMYVNCMHVCITSYSKLLHITCYLIGSNNYFTKDLWLNIVPKKVTSFTFTQTGNIAFIH